MKAKSILRPIIVVLFAAITIQLFQNCSAIMAPQDDKKSSSLSSTMSTPISHPNEEVIKPTTQSPILANRMYISELLSEVFESTSTSNSAAGIINQWVTNQSGIFGYPCNPREANGQADCGGILLAPMNPLPDTLRASHKTQVCLELTSNDSLLQNALAKIENRGPTPDHQSVIQLIKLFYRGEEDVSPLANELHQVDINIKSFDPNITDLDRWRVLVNMVCESPNWENL